VDIKTPGRDLSLVDFTLLVLGAVIGADVYVVVAIGAALVGPAQLLAWLIAGVLAAIIALAFVQCAAIYPQTGGSYAYAHRAFGSLPGFVAGWALYVGEWIALPVFPVAFANYLTFFFPDLNGVSAFLVKTLLIVAVSASNLLGARVGARVNDVLTAAKLLPLAVLILAGAAFIIMRPGLAAEHLVPFAPYGWSGLGESVLVIFWAYAGFELAVLPAGEVKQPRRTLPRGLIIGMSIATGFYLLTALAAVVALPSSVMAESKRSLADALEAILSAFGMSSSPGGWLMSLGAIVSIAGVYEAFTLGVARLSYALARDGLFPQPFAWLHARYGTPWVGLVFQAVAALVLSNVADLTQLIPASVLFLGICYALTALAALRLVSRAPGQALHVPGLKAFLVMATLAGVFLSLQAPPWIEAIGLGVMLAGLGLYFLRRGTWTAATELESGIRHEERQLANWVAAHQEWLLRSTRRPRRRERSG